MEHTADGIRKVLADTLFDGDIEEQLMLVWYPEGKVTSKELWTTDLKYTKNGEGTMTIKSFSNAEHPGDDKSDKEAVVIPPYIDDGAAKNSASSF